MEGDTAGRLEGREVENQKIDAVRHDSLSVVVDRRRTHSDGPRHPVARHDHSQQKTRSAMLPVVGRFWYNKEAGSSSDESASLADDVMLM